MVYLGHAKFFFWKKLCRAHDILSRAHDLLSRAHDIISRAHDILSRAHDIISRAHDFIIISIHRTGVNKINNNI